MDGTSTSSPVPPRLSPAKVWLRALETTSRLTSDPAAIFPVLTDRLGAEFGDAPALLSDDETLSYKALAERSRRYTRWALAQGLQLGDGVALLMPNRPDYVALWLGLTRAGVVVSLLNTQAPGPALAHCLSLVAPAHIVVAPEFWDTYTAARPLVGGPLQVWRHGGGEGERIDLLRDLYSGAPLGAGEAPLVRLSDRALQIFTSGTTGLPKAANVSHRRVLMWSGWFAGLMGASPQDRLYNCLPLYHSVGGVVAIGGVLVNGGSVVIKDKFSARSFWADIGRWDCTLFQYIGELCRYLLNAPSSPLETGHRLRLACGNGLSADVWEPFQTRFQIPQILEFYAATEGNFSLYNVEGRPGAVGRLPTFLSHRFPAAIVAFDPEAGVPARGTTGFCQRCETGETGEVIARISDRRGLSSPFEGYSNEEESDRKTLRDVFELGDAWFRSGDLMRQDQQGFYYFVDRVGDTFRWKGENVSTGEVASALTACSGVLEAYVYGVSIPGADGRAGMAALVVSDEFDPEALALELAQRLPPYARPLFLRLAAAFETTETFKPKKAQLAREGFDPAKMEDDVLFVADPVLGRYRPLDAVTRQAIIDGSLRL